MDRQETDIDALLIGALYGELTPAEEGRLAAHLESHPADRGALDDLKVARQAIHESRIFSVQLDPPQAVSALLLQEAHRRAPKRVVAPAENEGWFARFTRNFMAHPAMAAAAMLVLVLGGAGIVYMKKGDQFAAREANQVTAQPTDQTMVANEAPAPAVATPTLPAGGDGAAAPSTGSAFGANLYEGNAEEQAKRDENESDKASERLAADKGYRDREEAAPKKKASRSMEVTTERMPKDLDDAKESKNELALDSVDKPAVAKASPKGAASGSTATGTGASAGRGDFGSLNDSNTNAISGAGVAGGAGGNGNYAQPPPPPGNKSAGAAMTTPKPAPAPTTTSTAKTVTAAPPKAPEATAAPAPVKQDAKPDSALIAWAKGEHVRAVSLAKNGSCEAAAKVALSVSNRATSYYSQYMATDRALKQCAQYINAERDREAERSQKARAQKRVNADEPATTTK